MNVLVACEESQSVCTAFRERGHNAFSCDILDPSGGHPEWHIKGDVLSILNPSKHMIGCPNYPEYEDYIEFTTMNGAKHQIEKWDLIIAHPSCTHLYNSGQQWLDILEKQIPKKIKYNEYGFGECPNCGGDTECVMYDYYEPYDYCTKCGQALDWGLEG